VLYAAGNHGTFGVTRIHRSLDGGATWTAGWKDLNCGGTTRGAVVNQPYQGNPDGAILYAGVRGAFTDGSDLSTWNRADDPGAIRKFVNGVATDIAPSDGAGKYYTLWEACTDMGLHVYTLDQNIIAFVAKNKMFRSIDSGSSWNEITLPAGMASAGALGGWPSDPDTYLIWHPGLNSGVNWTTTPNPTASDWHNAIGSWATDIGAFDGAVNVVPIWIP
jgi:hypothetical protein